MKVRFLDPKETKYVQESINSDPEFRIAAKFMLEDILIGVGDSQCIFKVRDGVVTEIQLDPSSNEHWSFSIKATAESWDKLLQSSPPPFYTGLFAGMLRGNLQIVGNLEVAFVYLWAMNRMLDIMRQLQNK